MINCISQILTFFSKVGTSDQSYSTNFVHFIIFCEIVWINFGGQWRLFEFSIKMPLTVGHWLGSQSEPAGFDSRDKLRLILVEMVPLFSLDFSYNGAIYNGVKLPNS